MGINVWFLVCRGVSGGLFHPLLLEITEFQLVQVNFFYSFDESMMIQWINQLLLLQDWPPVLQWLTL
jgi:hypothetical protein